MFSTNTQQNVLSYQSKTNNNRISNLLLKEENYLIFSTKKVGKAVKNHKHISAQVKLKEETTTIASKNSIVNPNKMMLSSVYRICIVCFFETLKLIKGTLEQIDGRRNKSGLVNIPDRDRSASPVIIKRERTVRKKYTTSAGTKVHSSNNNNVCYVRTKVDPGLLRQRAEKLNQERRSSFKPESYTKHERDTCADHPKRVRSITFPGDNGRATTIKVLSATKTPQTCCLKNPSQNYTSLVSALNGNSTSFDQFMVRASKNLGRGYKKRHSIPPTNIGSPRNSPIFRRRSLEVVLEEDE
jgi:hypothetical protein